MDEGLKGFFALTSPKFKIELLIDSECFCSGFNKYGSVMRDFTGVHWDRLQENRE